MHLKLTSSYQDILLMWEVVWEHFLKLFDHTVKPILLHACEVWGTVDVNSCIVKKDDYVIENIFKNFYCDKHMKALKHILGVHKYSVSDAILGETGRYPLYVDINTLSRLLHPKSS